MPSLEDDGLLYRFRSREALLGEFAELERQTIYFAKPIEVNDPMDGLTDVFWRGDEILWRNLFRHYVLSFAWYYGGWLVQETEGFEPLTIHGNFCEEDLPKSNFRSICREIEDELLGTPEMQRAVQLLASFPAPLRRRGLSTLLSCFHPLVMAGVFDAFFKRGMQPATLPAPETSAHIKDYLEALSAASAASQHGSHSFTDLIELIAHTFGTLHNQMRMIFLSNKDDMRTKKVTDLFADFTDRYIEALLRDLRHNPWRMACFSRNCTNASMWGVYAREHKGAALVFRPNVETDRRLLRVHGLIGTGAEGFDLDFVPVDYGKVPPPIDFFCSIGRLPQTKLEANWFRDRQGTPSARLTELTSDEAAWREALWAKYPSSSCWKHEDWRHEQEERLVATSPFSDDPAPSGAAFTYEFSQLEGIVFGMRTSIDDKMAMVKIIEKKCREHGRRQFRFFEADYLPSKGAMVVSELTLLKFEGL